MNIAELKLYIIQKILETNDIELLKKIEAVINVYGAVSNSNQVSEPNTQYDIVSFEKEIVAYTFDGHPLTKEKYSHEIEDIIEDANKGILYHMLK